MNLVASLIVRNERARYLGPCVESLLGFCDQVVIFDDASEDGTTRWLLRTHDQSRVAVMRVDEPVFFTHEGHARQGLLDFTLAFSPTHILAIDGDELVADGQGLRDALSEGDVWTLEMQEIWGASPAGLTVREDGGWRPHPIPNLYRVPDQRQRRQLTISPRQLSCGREPIYVRQLASRGRAQSAGEILHFGWANVSERQARYQRYVTHDGGKFHANAHLQSIVWPDQRCQLSQRDWPEGLAAQKDAILRATGYHPDR